MEAAAPTLEGTSLGRYRLRYKVAQGGMASVYLAQLEGTHGFERWVAVKVVHPHLAEERRFATMLLDEARVAARIHHPNVCAVLDFGEQDDVLYLVMEYLHGESLSSAMRRGWQGGQKLPPWISARIICDAARGLHAAHSLTDADLSPMGVVHRDVSPQNVLVLYDGLSKVVDFGIARARGRLTATDAGEVKGKFSYMSPEQLRSQAVDHLTDVWALGVVLWEATTGRRLFRAPSHGSTVMNVVEARIPLPSEIIPDYPPALEKAVMRTLERNPDARTSSAEELASDLELYLYSAGRPAGPSQVGAWMREHFAEKLQKRAAMLRSAPNVTGPVAEVDLHSESTFGSQVRASETAEEQEPPTESGEAGQGELDDDLDALPGEATRVSETRPHDDDLEFDDMTRKDLTAASEDDEGAPVGDAEEEAAKKAAIPPPATSLSGFRRKPADQAGVHNAETGRPPAAAPAAAQPARGEAAQPAATPAGPTALPASASAEPTPGPTGPAAGETHPLPPPAATPFAPPSSTSAPPSFTAAPPASSRPSADPAFPAQPVMPELNTSRPKILLFGGLAAGALLLCGILIALGSALVGDDDPETPPIRVVGSTSGPTGQTGDPTTPSVQPVPPPQPRLEPEPVPEPALPEPVPVPGLEPETAPEPATGGASEMRTDPGPGSRPETPTDTRERPPDTRMHPAAREPRPRAGGSAGGSAAPQMAPGTLNLLAIPPANVFLGQRSLGRTPLVNVELPPGNHTLTLRPLGGGPAERVHVRIRSGERTRETVRLGGSG